MQRIVLCSSCFLASTCRTSAVPFSDAMSKHLRFFSSKMVDCFEPNRRPQSAKQSETNATKAEPAEDSSTGVDPFGWEPTKWERFFLVLTRCYARNADIPAIIPARIGRKFGQRMRILRYLSALVLAIIIFFGLEFYFVSWEKRIRSGQLSDTDVKFVEKVSNASRMK